MIPRRDQFSVDNIDPADITAICDGEFAWLSNQIIGEFAQVGYPDELTELYVLASLTRLVQARMPQAIATARQAYKLSWQDLALMLDIPASTLRRRHSHTDPTWPAPTG